MPTFAKTRFATFLKLYQFCTLRVPTFAPTFARADPLEAIQGHARSSENAGPRLLYAPVLLIHFFRREVLRGVRVEK